MSFVSYAQNFEDVMLWRALGSIQNGSYIDIGAQDPVKDSVSLAFYQHGWRGLHLEPTHQYATALKRARPDERVRQAAVGSAPGQLTFYEFTDTGLSTGDQRIAQQHIDEGYAPTTHTVDVVTLDQLLGEWQREHGSKALHWLKIDVEGMEGEVIKGWQDSPVRPWVIVIESHAPGSQQHAHTAWEGALIEKGYQYVYTDGINRFYLAESQQALAKSFAYPPNVFDEFALSGQASHAFCNAVKHQVHLTEVRAAEAEKKLYNANLRLQAAEQAQQDATRRLEASNEYANLLAQEKAHLDQENIEQAQTIAALKEDLHRLLNSRSWRITYPIRIAVKPLKALKHSVWMLKNDPAQFKASAHRRADQGLKWCAWQVASRPRLKKIAMAILKRAPWLFERLTRRLNRATVQSHHEKQPLAYHQARITARARQLQHTLTRTPPRANRESRT